VPGLARLDDLVERLRSAGRDVTLVRESSDDREALPAAVDQAAFRIIQESLTNVVRHAAGAHVIVGVTAHAGTLTVEVSDDGPAISLPAEGNGIRGMRERAKAVGGRLQVLIGQPSGLVVRAELPLVAEGGLR
jgi:signal transduction histidine kinase